MYRILGHVGSGVRQWANTSGRAAQKPSRHAFSYPCVDECASVGTWQPFITFSFYRAVKCETVSRQPPWRKLEIRAAASRLDKFAKALTTTTDRYSKTCNVGGPDSPDRHFTLISTPLDRSGLVEVRGLHGTRRVGQPLGRIHQPATHARAMPHIRKTGPISGFRASSRQRRGPSDKRAPSNLTTSRGGRVKGANRPDNWLTVQQRSVVWDRQISTWRWLEVAATVAAAVTAVYTLRRSGCWRLRAIAGHQSSQLTNWMLTKTSRPNLNSCFFIRVIWLRFTTQMQCYTATELTASAGVRRYYIAIFSHCAAWKCHEIRFMWAICGLLAKTQRYTTISMTRNGIISVQLSAVWSSIWICIMNALLPADVNDVTNNNKSLLYTASVKMAEFFSVRKIYQLMTRLFLDRRYRPWGWKLHCWKIFKQRSRCQSIEPVARLLDP